jgi:gas vesicle protein
MSLVKKSKKYFKVIFGRLTYLLYNSFKRCRGKMSKKNNSGALFVGIVVGGLVGTVTGLLLAPRTGRETRRILKKSADALPELVEDLATSLQLQTDNLSESAQRNWQGTLDRLKEAIAAGVEASQMEMVETPEKREITTNAKTVDKY